MSAVWKSCVPGIVRIVLDYVAVPPVHLAEACTRDTPELLLWLIKVYGSGRGGLGPYYGIALTTSCLGGSTAVMNCVMDNTKQETCARFAKTPPRLYELVIFRMASAAKFEAVRLIIKRLDICLNRYQYADLLCIACRKGSESMASWILGRFSPMPIETLSAISDACLHGHIGIAKLLSEKYRKGLLHEIDHREFEKVFGTICQKGRVSAARWFSERFHVGFTEKFIDEHLEQICLLGRFRVLQWLVSEISREDAKECSDDILRLACESGHTPIVEWWFSIFDTSDSEIFNIICDTCVKGHLRTAKKIQEIYQIKLGSVRYTKYFFMCVDSLADTRFDGHEKAARWLEKTILGMSASAIRDLLLAEGGLL